MNDYTFQTLNDKEFEVLVNDILSEYLNIRIERFKTGKDGGVDGRFFTGGDETIIQSKHWLKSGISKLEKQLKNVEKDKIEKLEPKRYILVTSLPLSRLNKKNIKKIFNGFIKSEEDIFGQEDLNDLLKKYPNIEKIHYKLWLNSVNVLKNIINSGIIERSEFTLEEIKKTSSKYVFTDNHKKAQEKLETNHSIIITGAPGIGKTTMANQLSLIYAAKGYEFIKIEDSIKEAEDVFNPKSKQLFYYDDFLGRNFLLALEHHQDSKIINFIKRVSMDSKKKFILTSRSNILNQGKRLSDLFNLEKVERNEFEVKLESLSDFDKAQILYNHIWFGNLKDQFFDEILKERRYLKIIKHEKFNPRLISFITDNYRISNIDELDYWNYVKKTLDNPSEIWSNVIEIQTDEESRNILIGVVMNGRSINEESLMNFINRLRKETTLFTFKKTNNSIIKLLSGALLNRNIYGEKIIYDLFNPSIADFVINNYLNDVNRIATIVTSLESISSLSNLRNLYNSKVIDFKLFKEYLKKIYQILEMEGQTHLSSIFFIELANLYVTNEIKETTLDKVISEEINDFVINYIDLDNFSHINILEYSLLNNWIGDELLVVNSIIDFFDHVIPDWEILSRLAELVKLIKSGDEATVIIKNHAIEQLTENLQEWVIDERVYSNLYNYEEIDEGPLLKFINDQLSEIDIEFSTNDIESISENFDFNYIVNYNIETSMPMIDDSSTFNSDQKKYDQDIKDLFDRN